MSISKDKHELSKSWTKFVSSLETPNESNYFFNLFRKKYAPFSLDFVSSLKICYQELKKPTHFCDTFLERVKYAAKTSLLLQSDLNSFFECLSNLEFHTTKPLKFTTYCDRIQRFELEFCFHLFSLTRLVNFGKRSNVNIDYEALH